MANTFVKIASVTVGSGGASTIDFSSIPQTYTDLCMKMSLRDTRSGYATSWFDIKLNGVTTNFSGKFMYATGSTYGSGTQAYLGGAENAVGSTGSVFSNTQLYIPNYTSSNYKTLYLDSVAEDNASNSELDFNSQFWSNTAAINQITLFPEASASFVQYSTAVLYGINKS